MAEKKSKVNEAGNYTMPGMRKKLFAQIKSSGSKAASQVSGLPVKHKCWPSNIKLKVEVIKTNV